MLHNRDRIRVSRLPANVEDTPENREKYNLGRMGIVLNTAEQFGNISVTIDETQNTLEDVLLIPADCVEVVVDRPNQDQQTFLRKLGAYGFQPYFDHNTGEYVCMNSNGTTKVAARNLSDLITAVKADPTLAELMEL